MATVYIETTIPSFYFETRTSVEIVTWRNATRLWWDRYRQHYSLFTSNSVLAELGRAPAPKGGLAAALLREVTILEDPPGLNEVVAHYRQHRLVPAGAAGDAYHLATASLHGMSFLLTWNCQHLANANKIRHMTVVNRGLGLPVPIITTPLQLVPEQTK